MGVRNTWGLFNTDLRVLLSESDFRGLGLGRELAFLTNITGMLMPPAQGARCEHHRCEKVQARNPEREAVPSLPGTAEEACAV